MQKKIVLLKKIILFAFLAIVIPWLNMTLFFALLSSDKASETTQFIEENEDILYNNIYNFSFISFIFTYILAVCFINRKAKKKLWKSFFYILAYFLIFIGLCLLP